MKLSLETKEWRKGWLLFKDVFLRAQELSMPQHKTNREDLLVKLRDKKEIYKQ